MPLGNNGVIHWSICFSLWQRAEPLGQAQTVLFQHSAQQQYPLPPAPFPLTYFSKAKLFQTLNRQIRPMHFNKQQIQKKIRLQQCFNPVITPLESTTALSPSLKVFLLMLFFEFTKRFLLFAGFWIFPLLCTMQITDN